MQLKTQCPNCQKTLRCPAQRVGTIVRCPACNHKFRVTSTASGTASMAAEPSMEVRHTIDSAASRSRDQRSGTEHCGNERSGSAPSGSNGTRRRQSIADLPSLGRFGQYDLKTVLGSGGFGVVYRAWDTQLERHVALKVPRFDKTDERKVRRFRQEARSAAKLHHPNIVVVLEEGMQGGKPFIVSEYVDGEPLSARIERGRPRYDDLSEMAADLDRWLQGKVTSVRPIRRSERAWRWCRSNPALATTGTLCTVFAALFVWNIGAAHRLDVRTAGAPKTPLGFAPPEGAPKSVPALVLPSSSEPSPDADESSLSSRSSAEESTAPTTEDSTAGPPAAAIAPFDADQAKRHQREWAAYLGVAVERMIELPGGQTLELVLIPPGEFLMGTTAEEELRMRALAVKDTTEYTAYQDVTTDAQDVPRDRVQPTVIDEPFYLGKYEVTNEQWASLTNGQPPLNESDRRTAAGGLSWLEIQEAMKDLNENLATEGLRAGLPTRAHWEYVCRAGTATAWYFGDDDRDFSRFGWDVKNAGGRLREVGQLEPNAWGLFDTLGNAWEWCANSPVQQFDSLLSAQVGGTSQKYMCGGSAGQTHRRCRPSTGTVLPTDYRDHLRGFRLAVSLIREPVPEDRLVFPRLEEWLASSFGAAAIEPSSDCPLGTNNLIWCWNGCR